MTSKVTPERILSTNGLSVPSGFPFDEYESIHKFVSGKLAGHTSYEHFAGSWNAIAYRYCACIEHGDNFINSLSSHGPSPKPKDRYDQERMLFDFFSSAFATFEALFYGMYALGTIIDPSSFSLATEKEQQKVSPSSTQRAFISAFPGDDILLSLQTLFDHAQYQTMREIRNVLTHRTAPGRRFYVSLGSDDQPTAEWKLNNKPIDEQIITDTTVALGALLKMMMEAVNEFINRRVIK